MRSLGLWRKALARARCCSTLVPADLPIENLAPLHNAFNGADVYLLGTMHISRRSADQVQALIRAVKPDIVAVELCPARTTGFLEPGVEDEPRRGVIREFLDCPGTFGEKLIHVVLKFFYQGVRDAGIETAAEFTAAGVEALRIGAEIHLIDEHTRITRERLNRALTMPVAFRLFKKLSRMKECRLLLEAMQDRDSDAIEALNSKEFARKIIEDLRVEFPEVIDAVVDQRDEMMTRRLRLCEGKIVAVVGLAHMSGIEERWNAYMSSEDEESLRAMESTTIVYTEEKVLEKC